MQDQLKSLVERRTRRSVAVIMSVIERDIAGDISKAQYDKLRKVVRDVIYDFEGIVVDVLESLDSGDVVLNELWLRKIDEIHQTVVSGNGNGNGHTSPAPEPMLTGARGTHRSPSEFGGGRPRAAP